MRISVRYPAVDTTQAKPYISQLYWRIPGIDWTEEHSRVLPIKQDGQPHVYWLFLDQKTGAPLTRLRFDPINGNIASTIQWIAVDLVK